ncbi:hypothetical protein ANCCAN_00991 [Ancylostoma caninum]|uniref:SCP domain-containing protein n=1 Tax=Ancylostoma caninum TaxID=29170 RepID=A0A368H8U9_ANCCA|nr:hypothetical protein ANCCAN_00991 [Ancylostoma caninum]
MSHVTSLIACAFYLLSIAYATGASKHELPACQGEGGDSDSNSNRRLLYNAILYATKGNKVMYSCELEDIARENAVVGIKNTQWPEKDLLYSVGERNDLSEEKILDMAFSEWKGQLQRVRAQLCPT